MGNRQVKAPFDVRDNIRIYHQYARGKTSMQEANKKNRSKLKAALYKAQFGGEPPADAEFKLVWFLTGDGSGRVPIVVTSASPTLTEVERKIIPNAYNWTDSEAFEYPLLRAKVFVKAGHSPIEERMKEADFYALISDGDILDWSNERMGCCCCPWPC